MFQSLVEGSIKKPRFFERGVGLKLFFGLPLSYGRKRIIAILTRVHQTT